MKTRRMLVALAAALLLCGLCSGAVAQAERAGRTTAVEVYFPKEGDSADVAHNPWNLQPVRRRVPAAAPLRPAIEALLAGPTRQEEQQGFGGLDVRGIYLVRVAVRNGTAYASFAHRRDWAGWSGDLSPFSFGDAVERTMKQFPHVRRTVVCVDGVVNFGDESGGPDKPCPKF